MDRSLSMSDALDNILEHKVLAIFRCGSSLYGLDTPESDHDYMAILEGYDSASTYKTEGTDYFVFGKESYKKVLNQESGVLDYFKVWADVATIAKTDIKFLDPDFEKEFDEIIKVDWSKNVWKWLKLNVGYFGFRLKIDCTDKTLYNIYKLDSIMERFLKDGVFISHFSEANLAYAYDFKVNESGRAFHKERLEAIIHKLEALLKEAPL